MKSRHTVADPDLTIDEVRAIVGDIDPVDLAEIVAMRPTRAELDAAVVWATGGDEAMRDARKPLAGKVEDIYDLLTAGEEEEDEDTALR